MKTVEAALATEKKRPLTLTLADKSAGELTAMATGPARQKVALTAQISQKRAKALGLSSRVVAKATKTLSSQGAALVTLKPIKAAAKAFRKARGSNAVTIQATSGSLKKSTTGTFTR